MTNCLNAALAANGRRGRTSKEGYKKRQRMVVFFPLRLRRSLNCWVHKRLPVCDPLSIQDQSVRGSDYCKFLCVLSPERERDREKERAVAAAAFSSTRAIFSSLKSEVFLNLWKHFLSTAAFELSRANPTTSTLLSVPSLLLPDLLFPWNLTGSEEGCTAFIEWWSGHSHHGLVPGAECVSGPLGSPFAWCRHGGGCGGM